MHHQPGPLVTPEAVLLDVPHAGPGTRIAARGLDLLVQLGIVVVLGIGLSIASRGTDGGVALVVINLVGDFLVIFGYPAIMEAAWRGRTLGKAAFGLRVVTREGAPIRFRHAVIRSALFLVDGILVGPTIGVLCLLLSRDTVRVGDLTAGTIVIRERSGAAPPSAVSFPVPYGYEEFVASLDVGGLTAEDYALVRGFLLRAPQLASHIRFPLAVELANPLLRKLRQTTPDMHPEVFFQCVAAATQRRYGAPAAYGAPPGWAPPMVPQASPPPATTAIPSDDAGFVPPG
ncbi:MAG TPA: RDD family protein [Acidimicrobiales bacterium]|nr:RDD family protein [Acidimicrobiales bacterium]